MNFREESLKLARIQFLIVQVGAALWFPVQNQFEYQHRNKMWCRTCHLIYGMELKHRFLGYDDHGGHNYMRLSAVTCSLGACTRPSFCSYKCIKQHIKTEHYDLDTRLTIFKPEPAWDAHGSRGIESLERPRQRTVTLVGNINQPIVTDLENRLYASTRV
jgi:hypothetical protein